jgi:hypothetical protein
MEQVKHDLKTRPWQSFKENFKIVREEIKKFDGEVREGLRAPHANIADWYPMPGERTKEWGFQAEEELDQWVLTKDSDWGEGYSAAELELHPLGHAVLAGELSTRVPADGRTQAAGYVNISSVPKKSAFAQEKLMEHWTEYTHLTMNLRGDGRKYMINLKVGARHWCACLAHVSMSGEAGFRHNVERPVALSPVHPRRPLLAVCQDPLEQIFPWFPGPPAGVLDSFPVS